MFPKKHKYGAKKTFIEGESDGFPSILEANVWKLHRMLEKAGEIKNLRRYPSIEVRPKCQACGESPVRWKIDMCYETKSGKTVFIEAKGANDRSFLKRLRLWKKKPLGRLEIWRGTHYPKCMEVVE